MRSPIVQRLLDNTPEEVAIFVDLYGDLTVRVNTLLREKGITKASFLIQPEKDETETGMWLSGEFDFQLRSIAQLSAELGAVLIEVPGLKK